MEPSGALLSKSVGATSRRRRASIDRFRLVLRVAVGAAGVTMALGLGYGIAAADSDSTSPHDTSSAASSPPRRERTHPRSRRRRCHSSPPRGQSQRVRQPPRRVSERESHGRFRNPRCRRRGNCSAQFSHGRPSSRPQPNQIEFLVANPSGVDAASRLIAVKPKNSSAQPAAPIKRPPSVEQVETETAVMQVQKTGGLSAGLPAARPAETPPAETPTLAARTNQATTGSDTAGPIVLEA